MPRAGDAQGFVDRDPAAGVEREAELGQPRVRRDAGRPHDGAARDAPAVGQRHAARVGGGDRRVGHDLDPAAPERASREAGEALGRLAEDPRAAVDEHPVWLDAPEPRVAAQGVGGELVQLGGGLDAGVAGPGEDERQPRGGGVGRRVGELDQAQDVAAQADRVGEVLERERVLAQARHGGGNRATAPSATTRSACGPSPAEGP